MTDEVTTNVLNRLKSIEGHVRGIERIVEDEGPRTKDENYQVRTGA
jgi:DNA-binding FrmR family transcriptional regulator